MPAKQDLRVQKTHKFLFAALFELMEKMPFDEISVTDICQQAMVHRTTFYNHFEDKYHLLRCAIIAMQEDIMTHIPGTDDPQTFYLALLDRILDHLYDNRETYCRILKTNSTGNTTKVFHEYVVQRLVENLNAFSASGIRHPAGIPNEALAEFYTGAFFSLACWWLQNGLPIEKEQLRHYIHELVQ